MIPRYLYPACCLLNHVTIFSFWYIYKIPYFAGFQHVVSSIPVLFPEHAHFNKSNLVRWGVVVCLGDYQISSAKNGHLFLNLKWYSWVNSLLCCRLIRIIFSVESCWIHLFVVKLQFLRYERLSGWWFQPLWNILVSWDAQYMGKCSKPPISCNLVITKSRCFAFLTDVVLTWLPMFVAPNSSPHPPWWVG